MSTQVSSATVAVFPTFKGFRAATDSETRTAGQSGGKAFDSAFKAATANTAANITKGLEAKVRTATQSLSKARLAEADSLGKTRAAQATYNETLAKYGSESARAISAEERLAAARRKSDEATAKVTVESNKLKTAQSQLADATTKTGDAGEKGASKFAKGWESVKAKLTGILKPAVDDASKKAVAAAGDGGKRAGSGFLAGFKGMMGGLALLGAGTAITGFFKSANAEATESVKVNAITANALKQTGAAAWITADQVGDLATAISNKTGIDDEAIQSSANLLLTFKNVRNEVGEGANIFDRAAAAAQDMAAAGFGDAEGASKMLGKALNDPIAGISALGRAGITFTAQQKDQIKAMVASGDVLGAQRMIMKEVESQVGGAAEASATAAEKLATKWGNFKESIGTALLPAVNAAAIGLGKLLDVVGPKLVAAVERGTAALGGLFTLFTKGDYSGALSKSLGLEEDSPIVGAILKIREGAIAMFTTLREGVGQAASGFIAGFGGMESLLSTFSGLLPLVSGPLGILRAALMQVFSNGSGIDFAGLGAAVGAGLRPVAEAVAQVAGILTTTLADALAQLLPLVMQVFSQLGPVIMQVVATLAQLAVQLAPLVAQLVSQLMPVVVSLVQVILPPLLSIITTLVPAIMAVVAALLPVVTTLIQQLVPVVLMIVQTILPPLIAVFLEVANLLVSVVIPVVVALVQVISAVLVPVIQALMPIVAAVFGAIAGIIGAALTVVQGIIQVVTGAIKGDWGLVWEGVKSILSGVWQAITSIVGGAINIVASVIQSGLILAQGIVTAVFNAIVAYVTGIPARFFAGLNALAQLGAKASEWVGGFLTQAKAKFTEVVSFVTGIPGRIQTELGRLAGIASSAGAALMNSLASGIRNAVSGVISTVRNAISGIAAFFPHSPAKTGPFSGAGYTDRSGKALMTDFAQAIEDTGTDAVNATATVLGKVQGQFSSTTVGALGSSSGAAVGSAAGAATAAPGGRVEALLERLIAAVEAGQQISLDGRALIGETTRRMSQALSSNQQGTSRANGTAGLVVG